MSKLFESARWTFAMYSTTITFALIWFDKVPDSAMPSVYLFLAAIAGGFGIAKATQHFRPNEKG